jgi:hypothetical protein
MSNVVYSSTGVNTCPKLFLQGSVPRETPCCVLSCCEAGGVVPTGLWPLLEPVPFPPQAEDLDTQPGHLLAEPAGGHVQHPCVLVADLGCQAGGEGPSLHEQISSGLLPVIQGSEQLQLRRGERYGRVGIFKEKSEVVHSASC